MNNARLEVLMQCPCSGNDAANPLLLLAVLAGVWLLFNWVKTLLKSKGVSFMNKTLKIIIVVTLIAVVGIVFALKQKNKASVSEPVAGASSNSGTTTESKPQNIENPKGAETTANLPRLVDLGAKKCIPCKMMAPILEELKKEFTGVLNVDFIDVWQNPDGAKGYDIRVIPTQIFYDANGKELFRHEGFFAKKDILAKWKELGVELAKTK
jgi:thioredoxin 1